MQRNLCPISIFAFYNSIKRIFKDGAWWDYYYATLSFDYKLQKLLEKFGSFEYSAYLCNNNKRKESYMETKDKKIQVHTIDYKDIDKFFPAHSEISSKVRKHTVKLFSR